MPAPNPSMEVVSQDVIAEPVAFEWVAEVQATAPVRVAITSEDGRGPPGVPFDIQSPAPPFA